MELQTLGKALIVMAVGLAVVGALFWLGGRVGLGSVPGNFRFGGQGWGCFVPLTASIIVSIVLTLLLNLFLRWFR